MSPRITSASNLTVEQVTERVGDRIARGLVAPELGHGAIGSFAAWRHAEETDLAVSIGGSSDHPPSALYRLAGDPDELEAYGRVLSDAGVTPPWWCPDCAVRPGQRHEDGCDVGRCPACGQQALQCDAHLDAGTQTWTGRWPGSVEVEEGLARDLNHLAVSGLGPEPTLVWDRAAERYVAPPPLTIPGRAT